MSRNFGGCLDLGGQSEAGGKRSRKGLRDSVTGGDVGGSIYSS